MDFQVQFSDFRGPLDLLHFLVRRHEIFAEDVPCRDLVEQLILAFESNREGHLDEAAQAVEAAAAILEIKSRRLLPHPEFEVVEEEPVIGELVPSLLEYKRVRDAASLLEEMSADWQLRIPRFANANVNEVRAPLPLRDVDLWDLVSAMGRIQKRREPPPESTIIYDETPLPLHMERVRALLENGTRVSISDLFRFGAHKSTIIGLFLAILELIRHGQVQFEQEGVHGEVWLSLNNSLSSELANQAGV